MLSCLFLFLLILTVSACGNHDTKNPDVSVPTQTDPVPTQEPLPLPTAYQVETQLRQDAYPQSSVLMGIVGEGVSFSNITITDTTVTFTLTAPHFGEKLIAWYDALDDLEEGALEQQVQSLMASPTTDTTLTLRYTRQGTGLLFSYTEEYLNAAGCGIREFYNHIYKALLTEMGVNAHG